MALERFEAKVERIPLAGCWLWTGAASKLGYGTVSVDGRKYNAHRFAWEAYRGAIPPGQCVLHRCDVPSCVNPDHLFLGSMKDNTRDMMKKGRDRFTGERNPSAKLTDADVEYIRQHHESCVQAARKFGVGRSQITAIRRGESRRQH
jgi:hypothetical protein